MRSSRRYALFAFTPLVLLCTFVSAPCQGQSSSATPDQQPVSLELQLVGHNLQIVTETAEGKQDNRKLAVSGDLAKAEAEFKASIAAEPTSPESKNNLAVIDALQGRNAEAVELFRQALAQHPNYVIAQVNLGLVQLSQGDSADA